MLAYCDELFRSFLHNVVVIFGILADRTNGRAYGTMLCPSVVCL